MQRALLRIVGCLTLLALLVPCLPAQSIPCAPRPDVKRALSSLPEARDEKLKALKEVRTRFPNDLFVERVYQDTAKSPTIRDRDAVVAEYRGLAEKNPDNPLFALLAARSLYGVDTKKAMAEFEKLAPSVAWAHLGLADAYQTIAFKDTSKIQPHVEAFMQACPAAYEPYKFVRAIRSKDFRARAATQLRATLKNETDPDNLGNYSTLWTLEFSVKPAEEHNALRTQIAAELARLRTMDGGQSRLFYEALQGGYKQIGDDAGAKWAAQQLLTRVPARGANAVYAAYRAWADDHPSPKNDTPADKKQAYYRELLKTSGEWVKQYPDQSVAWTLRFEALRNVADVSEEAVAAAAEEYMKNITSSGYRMTAAKLLADKNVRPERARELLKLAIDTIDHPAQPAAKTAATWRPDYQAAPRTEGAPAAKTPAAEPVKLPNRSDLSRGDTWARVASIAAKIKDKDSLQTAAARLQAILEKNKPDPKADLNKESVSGLVGSYAELQAAYYGALAEAAKIDGRKQDALTHYQSALLARVKTYEPEASGDRLAPAAEALYKELQGSASGWKAWMDSRADIVGGPLPALNSHAPTWLVMEKKIPEFSVQDLTGARWTLESFKGKTVFINVWATW